MKPIKKEDFVTMNVRKREALIAANQKVIQQLMDDGDDYSTAVGQLIDSKNYYIDQNNQALLEEIERLEKSGEQFVEIKIEALKQKIEMPILEICDTGFGRIL